MSLQPWATGTGRSSDGLIGCDRGIGTSLCSFLLVTLSAAGAAFVSTHPACMLPSSAPVPVIILRLGTARSAKRMECARLQVL